MTDLSAREREVLAGIARGLTNAEIAADLRLGFESVKTYVSRIRARLGLKADRPSGQRRGAGLIEIARHLTGE